jgi:hypothetical protein
MTNRAEIVISAVDKASAVVNRIADRMDALGAKSNIGKAWERLGNSAALERVNDAMGKIAGNVRSVAMYGSIAAGAVGLAFTKSVNAVDDFADSMANAGIKGRQLAEVSAIRDFMGQFGVESEDASSALIKLTGNMSAARAGAETQQAAFAAAGISMADLKKKTPVEVLQKMMNVFNQSDKAGAKIKVLQALAGKSSTKMADALSQGADTFEAYKQKSKNALLTEKDFEDSGNAADALTRISGLVARAGQKMAAVAAPKLQAFLDRRESGLLELIPKLVDWVDRFISSIDEKKVMQFFDDVGGVFSVLGKAFRWLNENVNTTLMVVAALGVVFAPTIVALSSIGIMIIPKLIQAVWALGAAFMANPMFLAIGLLAGAAYLIYRNWDGIVGGLAALWEGLAAIMSAVWALIAGTAMLAIGKITGWFTGMYDSFVSVWDRIAKWFGEKLGSIASMLPDWLTGGSFNVNVTGTPVVAGAAANGPVAPASNVQTSAQTIVSGTSKTEVGGRIRIELTGAPARVTQMSSSNDNVPIDVSAGLYGVGA